MEGPKKEDFYSLEQAVEEAENIKNVLKRRRVDKGPRAVDYKEAELKVEKVRGKKSLEGEREEIPIEDLFDVVLFDWDGVMYDSMENIALYAKEVCRRLGKEIDTKEFLESYDQPFWDYYSRQGIPCETPEQKKYIYSIYHEQVRPVMENDSVTKPSRLFPEVAEAVRELKSRGLKIGIVSAHKPEEIQNVLKENDISPDYIIGLAHNKDEEIIKLCRDNDFDPQRVLMLGDLPSDLRDGRRAGVKVGAIARFPEAEDRLGSYDPDYLMNDLGSGLLRLRDFRDNIEHEKR